MDAAIANKASASTDEGSLRGVIEMPFTSMTNQEYDDVQIADHMGTIIVALAVAFLIAVFGAIYHMAGTIAAERESGMAQLLDVMMPNRATWQPHAARLISHHLAFTVMYSPVWIAMGAIAGTLAFQESSIAISLLSNLVCGLAFTSFAVFTGCCFREAQISGSTAIILSLAMSVIAQVSRDAPSWVIVILAVLFQPANTSTSSLASLAGRGRSKL